MDEDPTVVHARAGINLAELAIFDAEYRENPHAVLRRIAPPEHPVRQVRLPSGALAWVVTDGALARQILADRRFSKKHPNKTDALDDGGSHFLFGHMLSLDPPEHTRLRGFVSAFFLPRQVEQYRRSIQMACDELITSFEEQHSIDLVSEFAKPLALRTICSITGLPKEAERLVQQWSERLVKADFEDPSLFPQIADEMCRYFGEVLEQAPPPSGSVLARLAAAVSAGQLNRQELFSMTFLLLNAGYETTANLVSSGLLSLLRNRPQWAAICSDPSLTVNCVEELLRFESPLQMTTPRFASADVALAGQTIREGDMVFAALCAVNRDAAQFPQPDELNVARENAGQHISFGHGVHYCIGAHLARLEAGIAISALARSFPNLQYNESQGAPSWDRGFVMRGLTALPLVLRTRPDAASRR